MCSNQRYRGYFVISILIIFVFFAKENSSFASTSDFFLNAQSNDSGNVTSLMNSAKEGDSATTQILINSGADVNSKNIGGATALHIAARMNNVDVIKTLIKNGAKINAEDNDGWTPLMRASLAGNEEAVNVLLDNGADIWIENRWGESAFIHASVSSCEECIKSIISKVDFSAIDEKKLIKINKQIDESISISKKRQDQNIENILTQFSEKLNEKSADKVDGTEKKIYKLKDGQEIIEPDIISKSDSEDVKKEGEKIKKDDESSSEKMGKTVEQIEGQKDLENGEVEGEVEPVYKFTGKKIDKTKKGKLEQIKESEKEKTDKKTCKKVDEGAKISEEEEGKKDDSKMETKEGDSGEEVINLNSDEWEKIEVEKAKSKKESEEKLVDDKKKLKREEKSESEDESEGKEKGGGENDITENNGVDKLFIFTGDEKDEYGRYLKKSTQATPEYKNDFKIKEYDADIFEDGPSE